MKQSKIYIYGKHAVMEALLSAPHAISKVFLAPNVKDQDVLKAAQDADIPVDMIGSKKKVRSTVGSDANQGIIGVVSLKNLMRSYDDYIASVPVAPKTSLVLLGEITDPHNVGAIIRSAAAFGASGVLIPQHRQAPITGTVTKVSAGMAFTIPLIEIGNVNLTIRDLKNRGFTVYGLDGSAETTLSDEPFDAPAVFIFGNESTGIREKTSGLCDTLLKIPMSPKTESLNVAASAAVTLYSWSLKKK